MNNEKKDLYFCLIIGLSTGFLFFITYFNNVRSVLDEIIFVSGFVGLVFLPMIFKKINNNLVEES